MSGDRKEIIKRLKTRLDGYWEYVCEISSNSAFENGERIRGGLLVIKVGTDWIGANIEISGLRIWGGESKANLIILNKEIAWATFNTLHSRPAGAFGFTSFSDDPTEQAYIKTTYEISADYSLKPGNFLYYRDDKEAAEGTVIFRKIQSDGRLVLGPKNFKVMDEENMRLLKQNKPSSKHLSLSARG